MAYKAPGSLESTPRGRQGRTRLRSCGHRARAGEGTETWMLAQRPGTGNPSPLCQPSS